MRPNPLFFTLNSFQIYYTPIHFSYGYWEDLQISLVRPVGILEQNNRHLHVRESLTSSLAVAAHTSGAPVSESPPLDL